MKLDNFPPSYYITLEDSKLRQETIERQFQDYGVKNYTKFIAFDGRVTDYCKKTKVEYRFPEWEDQLDSGIVATMLSHMSAIKYWLENSDTPTAVFFEDDMNMSTCNFWNFTWDKFIDKINQNQPEWEVIQLSLIKSADCEVPLDEKDIRNRRRSWYNWSAGSYMITRDYAQRLVNHHIPKDNVLNTNLLDNSDVFPCIENMIYVGGRPQEYTIPIFVENDEFQSTFYPIFIDCDRKNNQLYSSQFVYNWWKENGPELDFDWFMTLKNTRYWEKNED